MHCKAILKAHQGEGLDPATPSEFARALHILHRFGGGNALAKSTTDGIRERYGALVHPGAKYSSFDYTYAIGLRIHFGSTEYRTDPFATLQIEALAAATLAQVAVGSVHAGVEIASDGGTLYRSFTERGALALEMLKASSFAESQVIQPLEIDTINRLITHSDRVAAASEPLNQYDPATTCIEVAKRIRLAHESAQAVDPEKKIPCVTNGLSAMEATIVDLLWSEELHTAYQATPKEITPERCEALAEDLAARLKVIEPPHLYTAFMTHGGSLLAYPNARYCIISASLRAADRIHAGGTAGGFEALKQLDSVVLPALLEQIRADDPSETEENEGGEEFQRVLGTALTSAFEGASAQFRAALADGDPASAKELVLAGLHLAEVSRLHTLPSSAHILVAEGAETWSRLRAAELERHLRERRDSLVRTAPREAILVQKELIALQSDHRFGLTPSDADQNFSIRDAIVTEIVGKLTDCRKAIESRNLPQAVAEIRAAHASLQSSKDPLGTYAPAMDTMVTQQFDKLLLFATTEIGVALKRFHEGHALSLLRSLAPARAERNLPEYDPTLATQVVQGVLREAGVAVAQARVPTASAQAALDASAAFEAAWRKLGDAALKALASSSPATVTADMHQLALARADAEFLAAIDKAGSVEALTQAAEKRLTMARAIAADAPELPAGITLADFGHRMMRAMGRAEKAEGTGKTADIYHAWLSSAEAAAPGPVDSLARRAVSARCRQIEEGLIEDWTRFTPEHLHSLQRIVTSREPLARNGELTAAGLAYCAAAISALEESEALAAELSRAQQRFEEPANRPPWIAALMNRLENQLTLFDEARVAAMPTDGLSIILTGCQSVGDSMRRVVQLSKRIELDELDEEDGPDVSAARTLLDTRFRELNAEITLWWARTVALQRTAAEISATEALAAKAMKAMVAAAADRVNTWNETALDERVLTVIFDD